MDISAALVICAFLVNCTMFGGNFVVEVLNMQLKSCTFRLFFLFLRHNCDKVMKFVRTIPGFNHLWAVKEEEKETDELSMLFRQWSNFNYLLDFFFANMDDLKSFFRIEKVSDAIKDTMEDAEVLERLILDFPYTEQLDGLFHPLSVVDNRAHELTREKARNWERRRHPSWLRIYAIRIEPNVYIVTGGAIKLTATMQERKHTQTELDKLNACRDFLKQNGVFDQDSFIDFFEEE